MNVADVINSLVEERGLEREKIVSIVCEGIAAAYQKKFPTVEFVVEFNQKTGVPEVFTRKTVVASVSDADKEISVKKAQPFHTKAKEGDTVLVPFEEKIGRIEIASAKQVIASRIREVEQLAIYDEFKDKAGDIISGNVHKRELRGFVVKVGEVLAFLPSSHCIPNEVIRVGHPIRAILKDVPQVPRGSYQLILDRTSPDFVKKLIEQEIPEVFEGLVEIKKVVRIAGYKTKILVSSHTKEIDPVGTCVGVGGARIKPILKELGQEKIDLVEWVDSIEALVKRSLKPAEIDKVEMIGERKAMVWLDQDQRSLAIGKLGQNIILASRLTEVEIQLQEASGNGSSSEASTPFSGDDNDDENDGMDA